MLSFSSVSFSFDQDGDEADHRKFQKKSSFIMDPNLIKRHNAKNKIKKILETIILSSVQ